MSKITNMDKQKVYTPVKENEESYSFLISEWSKDINEYIPLDGVEEAERYLFTPGELIEKLKEAWNAGYNRCVFEVSPHNGIFGIPPIEEDYIAQQNIQ